MISQRCVKTYCKEDISFIENYEEAVNDKNRKWVCHHRVEILPCGVYSPEDLQKFGLYLKRPACELIFMTRTEHIKLHRKYPLKTTRDKMSKSKMGKRHSENTKKKMSESHIGKHLSEETKMKISKANAGNNNPFFGKHHTEETKMKISKANAGNNHPFFGKHHTEEYRKNKSKPILQYTKDGELLKEWFGAKEVERVLGIYQGNITKCCQGKLKSAGGFVWRYK